MSASALPRAVVPRLVLLSAFWLAVEPVGGRPADALASHPPLGPPGLQAAYRLAPDVGPRSNLVEQLTVTRGPVEEHAGNTCQWLALEARKFGGRRFAVWALGRSFPPRAFEAALTNTARYLFQEDGGPVLEYVHRLSGAAVLPALGAWEHLWPRPNAGASVEADASVLAPSVRWLGHRYALETTRADASFPTPQNVVRLALLPEVLVGVPSNSRTQDDVRRYDGSDYPMVRLSRDDYVRMIRAGMNCFRVDAGQADWLEQEPVFSWGLGGSDLPFPESLFRSTYLGPALFLDEPAVGTRDHVLRPRLAQEPEFRRALTPQIALEAFKTHFHEAVRDGAPAALFKGLASRADLEVGAMHFAQRNLYSWETMIASAAWQLTAEPDGGPRAVVFEPPGRLGSRRTLPEMNMAYGCQLPPDDPANLADLLVGFLRGAARAAGKEWGLSIYGAVDRADAPWLLTHAYDLGATHFFFWDNYQLACVPHGECLALAEHLQAHVRNHPHRDLARLRRAAEVVVLLPPGYDLGHTHMGRGNLWGLGELNLERTNAHGIRYREVMGNVLTEIERCRRLGIAFDLAWDLDGLKLDGYREIVRVREDGGVEIVAEGRRAVRRGARLPERPAGRPPQLAVEISRPDPAAPNAVTVRARATEGDAPVYYTTGADRSGVYHNVRVLWELYGPHPEDYRALAGRVLPSGSEDPAAVVVEARFVMEAAGRYRLRAATTDLAGRSTVVWSDLDAGK